MFNVGDTVRYTGRYRDACGFVRTSPGADGWIVTRFSGKGRGKDSVMYASRPNYMETAFYIGDFEFAEPPAAEEYESWFV